MALERRPAVRMAILGFLAAAAAGLLIGVVGYDDPWQEATVTAGGTGLGVAVVFYLYYGSSRRDATR